MSPVPDLPPREFPPELRRRTENMFEDEDDELTGPFKDEPNSIDETLSDANRSTQQDNLGQKYHVVEYHSNKRYMQYHGNQIDYLRKMRDGGIVRNIAGRETGRRKRMRTIDGALGFRELTGTGMSRQTGGAFVTPLTMSVMDRLE